MVSAFDFSDFASPLKDLPDVNTEEYTDEELGRELFRAGVSNRNVEDILAALRQAERLIGWYQDDSSGRKPREYEVVSHIVLPLFLGLGWSHQQIAVEWNGVDVSFFKRTPTTEENCLMVLEAKGLGQGLGEVLAQPRGYVRSLRLQGVRYILTTDGDSFFVYERPGEDWNPEPVGYLRVTSLQKGYVLPRDTDLVETLVSLQPNTV
jgi:hypothetical protein